MMLNDTKKKKKKMHDKNRKNTIEDSKTESKILCLRIASKRRDEKEDENALMVKKIIIKLSFASHFN